MRMTVTSTFVCFVLTITTVICVDREKLQRVPSPQNNFDINRYVGYWYYAAILPPCSFSGSSEFTNIVTQYTIQPDDIVIQRYTYRSISCTTVEITKIKDGRPGVFKNKDGIGNPLSGQNVVVATDYKSFAVSWGCTKIVGDLCQDAYLNVKTRKKEPKPLTWKIIEAVLQYYFGTSLTDMIRQVHDEKGCLSFDDYKPGHSVNNMSLHRLKKMYKK